MPDNISCPRCGFEQPLSTDCRKCAVNIPRYLELLRKRKASPAPLNNNAQKRQSRPKIPPKWTTRHTEADTLRSSHGVRPLGELFEESWVIYKRRLCTLMPIVFIASAAIVICIGASLGLTLAFSFIFPASRQVILVGGGIVSACAALAGMIWGQSALIFSVAGEDLGIRDSFAAAWKNLGSFIWVSMVLGFVVTGGFLLFVVPGVIFSTWFSFSLFSFAQENKKGMDALMRSKEYVRGAWLSVFVRLFILWLLSVSVIFIPYIGPLILIFYMPFMMIFAYRIYKDLKKGKGKTAVYASRSEKFKWAGAATLGYLASAALLISFLGTSLPPYLVKPKKPATEPPAMNEPPRALEAPQFLTELEGAWSGFETNGSSGWTTTIRGRNIYCLTPDKTQWFGGIIKAMKTAPGLKEIDIEITECQSKEHIGKTSLGIYKTDGNYLAFCRNEPGEQARPASFIPAEKSRCFYMERQRERP